MLLAFFLAVYSVFGWTPQEFERKVGFFLEKVNEGVDEAMDHDRLFSMCSKLSSFSGGGVMYPNSSTYSEHQKQENDDKVQDGRKVLVVTGWPLSFGRRMEIIDLGNKNFTCDQNDLPRYPSKLMAGTGGLINNETVMICGGFPSKQEHKENLPGDCFKLQPQKSKDWIKVSDLAEPRYFMGSGNVVLDGGKLLVHGGSNIFLNPWPRFYRRYYMMPIKWERPDPEKWYLKLPEEGYASTELVATNSDTSFTSAFSNQTMLYQHCNIQVNSTTFMVTGGIQSSHCFGEWARGGKKTFESPGCMEMYADVTPLRKTFFVNFKSGLKQEGPLLNIGRFNHGCERIEVNGASILIVAGGEGNVKDWDLTHSHGNTLWYLSSMEYLDLSNWKNGWKVGPDLPFRIGVPKLVASLDRSSLYAIGGEALVKDRYMYDKKINMGILEYNCKGQHSLMKDCQWQIMDQQLNHHRVNSIAIMIPDSLADILCMKK